MNEQNAAKNTSKISDKSKYDFQQGGKKNI